MRIKLLILSTLTAIALYIWLTRPSSDLIENIAPQTQATITEEPSIEGSTPKQVKTEAATSTDAQIETQNTVLNDMTFSTDPVVNTHTIFRNHQLCYSQLEKDNGRSIYMKQFLERMETEQAKYFEDYIEYCKKLNAQHPEYSLTDKDHILSQIKNSKPNSLWGQIISKEIEVADLTNAEITQLLKSNDISILQEAPHYLKTHYQEVVHWDLESVLGNHDYDYVNYIQQYAHQMHLCDLGAQCDANSTIMASLCFRDATSCGLDFYNYIENSLTPGQQADIKLAQTYLRSQYQ